jgi:Astacin (Peptidase family M12A)/F5/8 type C domain
MREVIAMLRNYLRVKHPKSVLKNLGVLLTSLSFFLISSIAEGSKVLAADVIECTSIPCLPNLAKSAQVEVSSTTGSAAGLDARWTKDKAIDGKRDSLEGEFGWSSKIYNSAEAVESIQFDFGSVKNLNRVDLYARNDEAFGAKIGDGFPVDFTIDVSTDGTNWSSVVNQSNYPKPTDDSVQRFTFAPVNARFARIRATKLGQVNGVSGYQFQVAEVEIYNIPSSISYKFSNGETVAFQEDDGDMVLSTDEGESIVFSETTDFDQEIAAFEDSIRQPDATSVSKSLSAKPILVASTRNINLTRLASVGTTRPGRLWKDNTVPYGFSGNLVEAQRQTIRAAIQNWNASSEVRWVEDPSKKDRVIFKLKPNKPNSFCGKSSAIGKRLTLRGLTPQKIKLGLGCVDVNSVQHEMGHAVGLIHEHQRCDRDNFVGVGGAKFCPGISIGGFYKARDIGPYDFDSIMNYLVPINIRSTYWVGNPTNIGNSNLRLSCHDVLGIHTIYGINRGLVPTSPLAASCNLARNAGVQVSSTTGSSPSQLDSRWTKNHLVDVLRDSNANGSGSYGWSSIRRDSPNSTESIVFDLGARSRVSRIDLYPRNDQTFGSQVGDGFPVDFTLDYSEDGANWLTSQRFQNYPRPGNQVQVFQFPSGAPARFVRINATRLSPVGGGGGFYFQLAEVEIYGSR